MILDWARRFMAGRYGADRLCYVLMAGSILFAMSARWTGWRMLSLLSYILMGIAMYRVFSRDIPRRYEENRRFLEKWYVLRGRLEMSRRNIAELRDYRHYRCPTCRQKIRVPRSRGRLRITCPKCRGDFERKT